MMKGDRQRLGEFAFSAVGNMIGTLAAAMILVVAAKLDGVAGGVSWSSVISGDAYVIVLMVISIAVIWVILRPINALLRRFTESD